MKINFNPYRDFIIAAGDNGTGKTTLIQKMFASKVPKERLFILNSSGQTNWSKYAPPENIIVPDIFNVKFLEQVMLKFASESKNGTFLIIDDADNFSPRKSDIFRSVTINARHLNVGIAITTRDLQALPIMMYRQAKYSFFGCQRSDYNVYYLATILGLENAKQLKFMPKFVFGCWDSSTFEFSKIKLNFSFEEKFNQKK